MNALALDYDQITNTPEASPEASASGPMSPMSHESYGSHESHSAPEPTPEPYDYPRYNYIEAQDGQDPIPDACPFCGAELLPGDEEAADDVGPDIYCPNDSCSFYSSPEMRAAYRALRAAGVWTIADASAMILQEMTRFRVDSAETADWVGKRMGQSKARMSEIDAMAKAEHAEIDERAARAKKADADTLRFFETVYVPQIEEWANEDRVNWGKRKSRALIHLTAGFRTSSGQTAVDDEQKGIDFAHTAGCKELTKESLVKAEVKKMLTSEDPDSRAFAEAFAHLEGAGESFYIDIAPPVTGPVAANVVALERAA